MISQQYCTKSKQKNITKDIIPKPLLLEHPSVRPSTDVFVSG